VTQGTTVMATKKNSFMTQITSAMDKAALGAAAATRLVWNHMPGYKITPDHSYIVPCY